MYSDYILFKYKLILFANDHDSDLLEKLSPYTAHARRTMKALMSKDKKTLKMERKTRYLAKKAEIKAFKKPLEAYLEAAHA